jgi:NitT/TauT family transport system permease protein
MRRLLNIRPRGGGRLVLGLLPLIAVALFYLGAAESRHAHNAHDKLLPTASAMVEAVQLMSRVDPLTGEAPLFVDTVASLKRIGVALVIATAITLTLGLVLGLLPMMKAGLGPLVAAIAVVPPIAILPILFIVFGLGEVSKIALIVIGITPVMVRDLAGHVAAIPEEQLIKAQTLGAGTWQTLVRVALPQALPRLLVALSLALGPAWVFLISAEAIAADVGLGYRIFLVRRYLSMDIIIPYVLWISLLAVLMDMALTLISRRAFPWAHPKAGH